MNIVYLHAHDAGRFIQPYGYPVKTPALMQLAREGTLFRKAFCAAPTCSPSRCAMLTGQTAHQSGMLGLAHRGFSLANPDQHLANWLKTQGYQTALSGVQHEFHWGAETPYDQRLGGHDDNGFAAGASEYIKKYAKAKQAGESQKPFFLACGFILPHRGYPKAGPDYDPKYTLVPAPLPDTPETRKDMAEHHEATSRMDRSAGIVLDALRDTGLDDETLIIFTVDHGIAFPMMKCQLFDTGMGVSLIVKYPGNPTAGGVCDTLVSHLDIYPTVCDFVGQTPPAWTDGHGSSLRPLLEGTTESIRDEVFGEVTYHAAYEPQRCIRTERYKLIKIIDDDLRPVPSNVDNGGSKSTVQTSGFFDREREPVQLYDVMLDPNERRNLANHPGYADILADLDQRLNAWMTRTDDPLLAGHVPAPKGAKLNLREHIDVDQPVVIVE